MEENEMETDDLLRLPLKRKEENEKGPRPNLVVTTRQRLYIKMDVGCGSEK